MSYATERAFAEQGYVGDYAREFSPARPLSDWDREELARDAAERSARIASRMADDKADKRARCTVDWNREFLRASRPITALQQQLSANGFDARTLDPVLIALREVLIQINQETTNG